jgi:hypothetical protein
VRTPKRLSDVYRSGQQRPGEFDPLVKVDSDNETASGKLKSEEEVIFGRHFDVEASKRVQDFIANRRPQPAEHVLEAPARSAERGKRPRDKRLRRRCTYVDRPRHEIRSKGQARGPAARDASTGKYPENSHPGLSVK